MTHAMPNKATNNNSHPTNEKNGLRTNSKHQKPSRSVPPPPPPSPQRAKIAKPVPLEKVANTLSSHKNIGLQEKQASKQFIRRWWQRLT
ncbi:MAG: hypothetical protein AAGE59_32030, partial [Cyanobacteria bacterium P01_F01_bin.86]